MQSPRKNGRRSGSAIVEFALVGAFIFFPILAGLATVGISLVAAMQVSNLNSTAGLMFSTGSVDLTQSANSAILLATASSLDMVNGSGVVLLTEVDATGTTTPPNTTCTALPGITFGPNSPSQTSKYCSGGVPTEAFTALGLNLLGGQSAYIAETYYSNPQFNWALAPAGTGQGIYQMAVF